MESKLGSVINGNGFESFFRDGLQEVLEGLGGGVGSFIGERTTESGHRLAFSEHEYTGRVLLEGHEISFPMAEDGSVGDSTLPGSSFGFVTREEFPVLLRLLRRTGKPRINLFSSSRKATRSDGSSEITQDLFRSPTLTGELSFYKFLELAIPIHPPHQCLRW
jgi:hypothetical protein